MADGALFSIIGAVSIALFFAVFAARNLRTKGE